MAPRITVGMPLYNGAELVADALRSLQQQTFADFEVIISVDGNDQPSAAACRPFLSDRRFQMVVHPERLDWVGNFNWLLTRPRGEFFCYRQHDDLAAPDFFEKLLALADKRPDASIVYADCQYFGERSDIEIAPSIEGDLIERLSGYIEQRPAAPVRGLIRSRAVAEAGPVRVDEFRSNHQVFVWLCKVIRSGPFVRLAEPIYLRRIHAENYHKQNGRWSNEKRLGDWSTVFTGYLEAVLPACSTLEERLYFQHLILDRISMKRPGREFPITPATPTMSGAFMRACFERLALEGQTAGWLAPDDVAGASGALETASQLVALQQRHAALETERDRLATELESVKNARTLRLARAIGRLVGRGG